MQHSANSNETRVILRFVRDPATKHISKLHHFRLNKVYYRSHAIINLLFECGVIWIKSDGAFLTTSKQTDLQTYVHTTLANNETGSRSPCMRPRSDPRTLVQ